MLKKILLVFILSLGFNLPYVAAEKGVWTKNKINDDACAIYQFPQSEEGNYSQRGKVVFFVIKDKEAIYVRIDAGYNYDEKKNIIVSVDDKDFKFFSDIDTAWSWDDDRIIVNAMIAGNKMTVIGFSSRGTETTDTYSLMGFTSSLKNLKESC